MGSKYKVVMSDTLIGAGQLDNMDKDGWHFITTVIYGDKCYHYFVKLNS